MAPSSCVFTYGPCLSFRPRHMLPMVIYLWAPQPKSLGHRPLVSILLLFSNPNKLCDYCADCPRSRRYSYSYSYPDSHVIFIMVSLFRSHLLCCFAVSDGPRCIPHLSFFFLEVCIGLVLEFSRMSVSLRIPVRYMLSICKWIELCFKSTSLRCRIKRLTRLL